MTIHHPDERSSAAPDADAPTGVTNAVSARVSASIENWKRKLLDLTKRNRLLNFKPARVATVTMVGEEPGDIFNRMYLRDRFMRFRPTEVQTDLSDVASRDGAEGAEIDEPYGWDDVDVPANAASTIGVVGDEWLQTTAGPDALDKSLRRLAEQARSSIEEQGVNTLFIALGMLHYLESRDSDQVLRAPLVLLTVELSRRSARTGYEVRAGDDDPVLNPALVEHLRRNFGISLPELPDLEAMDEQYDLQSYLGAVASVVAGQQRWEVRDEAHLALFSFQKFVMYKDLEANVDALATHRLITHLVSRGDGNGMTHVVGLPAEVRSMKLDESFPPESTFQVVDADSSQLRALAAVASDMDMVIQGPPGTGKSQTITNLIAQSLAAGKSVLFVAEKMAALQVVHGRLAAAGLGEFCLELHSTKANKRSVMKEIGAALDASLAPVAGSTSAAGRLPAVRTTLNEYVQAVHEPFGVLNCSPYHGFGQLGAVYEAPRLTLERQVDDITHAELEQTVRDLVDLAYTSGPIGVPARHAWRDSALTLLTDDDRHTIGELASEVTPAFGDVMTRASAVERAFGLPPIRTLADVAVAAEVAAVLRRSPGAPMAVLASDAWNAPPPRATELVEQGKLVVELREHVKARFNAEVLEQEHAGDIDYVERKGSGIFGFLAMLDGRYRAIRRRWRGYRLESYRGSMLDQVPDMRRVEKLRVERKALTAADAEARQLFSELWQGERSSWEVLEAYIRWVVEFRAVCVRHGLSAVTLEVAVRPEPDMSDVDALRASADEAARRLALLRGAMAWPGEYLTGESLGEIAARTDAIVQHLHHGAQWAEFERNRAQVAAGAAAGLLPTAMSGEVSFDRLPDAFRRSFWSKWLAIAVRSRAPLERFGAMTHEERVREFRELDQRVLRENRAALVGQLRDRVQNKLREPAAAAALPVLHREMAKQRAHAPLRRTLRTAEPAVRAIKPCWLMSPLTVAQYLEGGVPNFDVVVFDEASQLPAEDAVGAIIRGRQLVVVGDPKQLPPTNFFAVATLPEAAPLGDDGEPLYEDAESILEEYMGAGVPMTRLKWHYRSAHESLISFSNVQFYDADLYTFPSVVSRSPDMGLQFEHVAEGVYEGKGLNIVEARRVADAVVEFAREQAERARRGENAMTLGVGTFNLRQQLAVQDELEQRRRENPEIEPFFTSGGGEPFFVKNLENLQGDERDVIFLSVTYARAADGKLRYNFGPINGENGWRRLNVITTRARRLMRVFSSMRGDEISQTGTVTAGPKLLREFLLFAERGPEAAPRVDPGADAESPFERDVLMELSRRGYQVVPQVGASGYRIDIGVLDSALPGRFVCGIECDGVAYHASETARDRDRLRQQVLESRGWTIHRVWSTDWFKDRRGQVERMVALIDQSRENARRSDAERRSAEQARGDRAGGADIVRAGGSVVEDGVPGVVENPVRGVDRTAGRGDNASGDDLPGVTSATAADGRYVRPVAAKYVMAGGERKHAGEDLLQATDARVLAAITSVVLAEAPIHETDLLARVASMWATRAGTRIAARIQSMLKSAERSGRVLRRGEFLWRPAGDVEVRSRAGSGIPAERIAPEEFETAVLMVLHGGTSMPRAELVIETRAVLGFSRTGAALEQRISAAIEGLVARGLVGAGSGGLRRRGT